MNTNHPLVRQLFANMARDGGNSLVCAGIDPDMVKIFSASFRKKESWESEIDYMEAYLTAYIDIVAPHVAAFKANMIYFMDGIDGKMGVALWRIINHIHKNYPNIPVIVDCKAGEVEHSMEKWLKLVFDHYGADGIVINPYLGDEVFAALDAYPNKLVVSCCRTSNRGAARVQDQQLVSGRRVWEQMLVDSTDPDVWNRHGNVIPVLSSTAAFDPARARALMRSDQPILFAGVGAQGGSLAHLSGLLSDQRSGVMVGSSRALMYPERQPGETWQQAVERVVIAMRDELNSHR